MIDPAEDAKAPATAPHPSAPPRPGDAAGADVLATGIDPFVVAATRLAIEAGDMEAVRARIEPLHAADLADLIQDLDRADRRAVIPLIAKDLLPAVLAELDETVRDEVIEALGVSETAAAVADMEIDDALHVISELDEEDQQRVLDAIPEPDRVLIEQGLSYPDFSAGRLMQREMVAVPTFWTVGDTIDHLRWTAEESPDTLPTLFYDLYVVDPGHRPVGAIALSRLLTARRAVALTDLMQTELKRIPTDMAQRDVAFLFRQRDLTSAPVVDDGGRLVGVITIDDVVDVIEEEHEDEVMHLGGVRYDDLYSATFDTARSRFTWLLVNLVTAIIASLVIGLFDATIEQMVALAVLMPIVASMGGNAGTQSLTVAVRALATKELTAANAGRVVGKELLVGSINGVLFAVVTGAVTWVWFGDGALAAIIGMAMVINLIVAGLSGAVIPIVLDRLNIDPAIASSVFLTTVTDVVGFFAFLGLATWLLL
ncbi:MAG: magnesium transporter [Rhodospirillales bacterium]|jgi:magnesium transporter|nr:magnesium transporter [Rhodospirillales bacterium]